MQDKARDERGRCAIALLRCAGIVVSLCALHISFHPAVASGAIADSTEQNTAGGATLREQIKGLLGAGSETAVAALLEVHLAEHPDDALMQYNAACVQARLGNLDNAELHLRKAIKFGFHQFSVMKRDPDLVPLRNRTVFQSIMAARDAADSIFADRRNNHWLEELGEQYRLTIDAQRKIDIICAGDDESVAMIMTRLGEVADVESQFFGIALPNRITIVVLDPESARRIFGSPDVRGNYRHEMREMVITNAGRSLQHELAHAYHHAHMDAIGQEHPIWVQEGLACLFEAYRVDENGTIEFLPNDRQIAMKYIFESDQASESLPAAREFMQCSEERFKHDAPLCYPMARSLMEYIDEIGDVGAWYDKFVEHYSVESTGEAATVFAMNAPLKTIERNWREWVLTRDEIEPAEVAQDEPVRIVAGAMAKVDAGNADVQGNSGSAGATIVLDEQQIRASTMYQAIRPLVLEGRYEQAVPELAKLLEQFPDHGDARFDLALGYIKLGNRDAAHAEYELLKQTHGNLARMVLACLERSVIVEPRSVVMVNSIGNDAETQADSMNARKSDVLLDQLAPPTKCHEMNY